MAADKQRPLIKSFDQIGRDAMGTDFAGGDSIVQQLQKAVSLGVLTGFGESTALRLENLDSTMTAVLFQQEHLKLFSAVPRVPSTNNVFQWLRRDTYGSHRGAVGFREGGAPAGSRSKWTRSTINVKYLGTRGGYTHQAMVAGAMGGLFNDPVAEENRNRTLELLEKMERHFLWGNKAILDGSGNEVHFDGLVTQAAASSFASQVVIDKEGNPMDFEDFEDIGESFVTLGKLLNFAKIRSWWSPFVLSDLSKLKQQGDRRLLGGDMPAGYRTGMPLDGHQTQRGFLPFEDSIFLERVEKNAPLDTAESGAPTAPDAPTTAVAADATSKMTAGTYWYFTSAVNDAGESAATAAASGQAVAVGERVDVTVDRSTGATAYRIYRGSTNVVLDARMINEVPDPGSGANFVVADRNAWRHDAQGMGIIMHLDEADIAYAQMAPLIKWPLAITDTSLAFLLILYGVLVLKAPERVRIYKNVGRRTL